MISIGWRAWRGITIAIIVTAMAAGRAHADALVVTKAMQASTIAELFIEEQQIRVEIEVGTADLPAFANVLPDKLYQRLTGESHPLDQRLKTFLKDDWVIQADGLPLLGRLERVVPAKRLVRDEVTGEALAEQPEDAEVVIRLTIRYKLNARPQSLTIRPPHKGNDATASIGFVCYHNGLPVNDFRYLSKEVTVDLDWTDPWYSRFRHPNLRRKFDAPLSVYLYIEPYEVRQEIIVRPKDMQSWIDLGIQDEPVISVERQTKLKEQVATFLSSKNPVMIDGRRVEGRLDRIHFIRRSLRTTGIVEPPVPLDVTSATLGVIFVYPVAKLPDEVSLRWELFAPKIQDIPAVASDEAGGLPSRVTPEDAVLTWKNYLTNPTTPGMATLAPPPSRRTISIPVVSVICAGLAVLMAGLLARSGASGNFRTGIVGALLAALACGLLTWPLARIVVADPFTEPPRISDDQARELMTGLLHNVYHAFEHHDESLIYDRLSSSIAGDLLEEVYLETRRSMEVKNQGGLRISVKEVDLKEITALGHTQEPTLPFRCRWRVAGWIGHWGHIHRRTNEHLALLTIAPIEGRWKISGIEMIDERPVESTPPKTAPEQASPE